MTSRGRPSKTGASVASALVITSSIGMRQQSDAETVGDGLRFLHAHLARERRRQPDAEHAPGTERVDRDGGAQRRVDAAGQAEHDSRETVLRDVVSQADNQRAVGVFERARRAARPARVRSPIRLPSASSA